MVVVSDSAQALGSVRARAASRVRLSFGVHGRFRGGTT